VDELATRKRGARCVNVSRWGGSGSRLFLFAAALTLGGCGGKAADPVPTDDELRRFTNGLERDAQLESKAALSEARRGEIKRASAAEARLQDSARQRRASEAQ
jgi:hypothetical protein